MPEKKIEIIQAGDDDELVQVLNEGTSDDKFNFLVRNTLEGCELFEVPIPKLIAALRVHAERLDANSTKKITVRERNPKWH